MLVLVHSTLLGLQKRCDHSIPIGMLVSLVVDVFGSVTVSTPTLHLAVTRLASTAQATERCG